MQETKFCSNCGAQIHSEAIMCPKCGHQQPNTSTIPNNVSNNFNNIAVENNTGKTLHGIGIATIIVGSISSLILSINIDIDFPVILIVGGLASFITGMCFIGFAEIISLLQANINKQDEIIKHIKNSSRS